MLIFLDPLQTTVLEEELGENKSALATDIIPTLLSTCIDTAQEISAQEMPLALELCAGYTFMGK